MCEFVVDKPSSLAASELESAYSNLKNAFEKVLKSLLRLQELTPVEFDAYEDGITNANSLYQSSLQKLLTTMSSNAGTPTPALVSAPPIDGQTVKRSRANDALKPFVVTRDHTPVEMRSWVTKFKAFYSSSCLERCSVPEQHAYFRICVDAQLEARIRDLVR